MKILINIIVSFVLSGWPLLLMTSPMMFDAPGSENDKRKIITIMVVLSYPIGLFLLLALFKIQYFGVSSIKLTIISAVVIGLIFTVSGYFGMLVNGLKGIANSGYSVANNQVYYDAKILDGADGASFTILNSGWHGYHKYAKDNHSAYCDGKLIEGLVSNDLHLLTINRDAYWHNTEQVIHNCKVLRDANPANFSGFKGFFNSWTYSINDGQYIVFYGDKALYQFDQATFTPLSDFIAKDKNQIFNQDKQILTEADPVSFELLQDPDFGKDENHVYYLSEKQTFVIADADPASFEVLNGSYVKDKNHVYIVKQYESVKKLQEADVNSFEVTHYDEITKSGARDKNNYYDSGEIVGER